MRAITLQSLGAAGTVTGSKHLLSAPDIKILVDCGLFQGLKSLRGQNWMPLPVHAASIDVVLLTHAHLDHCGYIPLLVKQGFKGKIYMSKPTLELTKLILLDSAKLQEEEAENANDARYSKHHPAKPLYTVRDAEASFRYFTEIAENEKIKLTDNCSIIFKCVGHILGACSVMVQYHSRKILFSGDIGRTHSEILPPLDYFEQADYVVMESTYGDKLHEQGNVYDEITRYVNQTVAKKGNIIIPSFAVGRAQELLYILTEIKMQGGIAKHIPIILDSPMGASATEISVKFSDQYLKVPKYDWEDMLNHVKVNKDFSRTEKIVNDKHSKIIIAASGMLTGGRVLQYLKHDLGNPNSTILIIGFQAEGTRGRALLNGAHELKIHGRYYPVKCKVVEIRGLSAHADQAELMIWLKKIRPVPKLVMLVHGEGCALEALRVKVADELEVPVQSMKPGEEVTLFTLPDEDISSPSETLIPNADNPFAKY